MEGALLRHEVGDQEQVVSRLEAQLTASADEQAAARRALEDGLGKRLAERTNLQPNSLEEILRSFSKRLFAAGEYRLALEGVLADGTVEGIDVSSCE